MLRIFTLLLFMAVSLAAPAQTIEEGKTILGPPPADVSGRVTDKAGKPLAAVSVSTRLNGNSVAVKTDNEGKFLLKKVSVEGYVQFAHPGYDSTEMWIGGKTTLEATMIASANKTKLNIDKESLQVNNQRMRSLGWKDFLVSHDSLNYRLEMEGTGAFLEFGIDEKGHPFGNILLRFQYMGNASSMPKFLGKKIPLTSDEVKLVLDHAAAANLPKLKWLNANNDNLAVVSDEHYYAGQFEYSNKDRYTLMIKPYAAAGAGKADKETISRLKEFSSWFKEAVYSNYKEKINAMIEDLKGYSHSFLGDWTR